MDFRPSLLIYMLNKLLRLISEDIAIDLGTANSEVYVRGRGIVIQEPSVVAINQKTGQILAIGEEAKKWLAELQLILLPPDL